MSRLESDINVNNEEESDVDEEPEVEVIEDGQQACDAKQRRKKRFKLFVVFHGDRASRRLPHSVRVKCPRDGTWEHGPRGPALLLQAFTQRYRQLYPKTPLPEDLHLVNSNGVVVDADDELRLYVESEGVLHVILGTSPKPAPNIVLQWGYNALASKEPLEPAPLVSLSRKRVVSLDCGWLHAAAVLENGWALAWGSNDFGQLGTGDERKSSDPVRCQLPKGVSLRRVSCGSYFTCAIDAQGDLYSWGRYQASNWPTKFVDTWVNGYEKRGERGIKGESIKDVACGESHTVVATESAKLFSWGYNEQWQLGWGQNESEHQGQQKPKRVNVPSGTIQSLSAGGQHTCCVIDGKLYAWGSNYDGQIGQVLRQAFGEPQTVSSMEHETCVAVSCGRHSTLALTKHGNAFLWGSLSGSTAAPNTTSSASAEEENAEEGEAPDFGKLSAATRMLAGAAKQLVSTEAAAGCIGEAHGLLLTKSNHLEGWGYNAYGQATGAVDPNSDTIEQPQQVNLDAYQPDKQQVLNITVAGGTTTILLTPA